MIYLKLSEKVQNNIIIDKTERVLIFKTLFYFNISSNFLSVKSSKKTIP